MNLLCDISDWIQMPRSKRSDMPNSCMAYLSGHVTQRRVEVTWRFHGGTQHVSTHGSVERIRSTKKKSNVVLLGPHVNVDPILRNCGGSRSYESKKTWTNPLKPNQSAIPLSVTHEFVVWHIWLNSVRCLDPHVERRGDQTKHVAY